MLTEHAPLTGADFMRLDLATVRQGLQTLLDDGAANGGYLSPEQSQWFNRYLGAWEFYRASQPQGYQEEMEQAIAAIFGYRISL
jgi:hypothetical protein